MLIYQAKYLKRAKKLIPAWQGPFQVKAILPHGAVQVVTLTGNALPLVNGSRLKKYHS